VFQIEVYPNAAFAATATTIIIIIIIIIRVSFSSFRKWVVLTQALKKMGNATPYANNKMGSLQRQRNSF